MHLLLISRSLNHFLEKERMKLSSMNMLQLLFILISATTIIAKDIVPGSKLYASNPKESWSSPNKLFSLSFIQESEGTYFAAITYNGVPIWKAGGDPWGAVSSSARLEFTANGNLLLFDDYPAIVWKSNTQEQGITSASLENSGNFVLKIGNISQWTTFDNPTDTILPGQSLIVNNVLRCGLYSLNLSSSGVVSLRWNNSVEYYTSSGINNTGNLNMTSPSLSMQSEGLFLLYHSLLSSPVVMARGSDFGETSDKILRFVKLDCDGNMKMYSSSMSGRRESKSVTWTAVSDQCKIFGFCGDFGICRYDEVSRNPICSCPSQNFLMNKRNGGRNSSCGRKMDIQNCQTTMLPLHNTFFLTFPPETESDSFTSTITDCSSNCLINSSCIASSFLADGTGVCYMKKSRFISGYQSPAITSTSYVKVCKPAMPNPPISSRKVEDKTVAEAAGLKIAVVVLGSSLVMVILVVCSLWLCCRSKPRYKSLVPQYTCSDYASSAPVQFSYKELQQETKGFKEKVGEGGFGSVYKGVLSNKMVVAVKQLEGIGQGEKQFRMEVATISSTHHLNLVRLVGFCSEGKHRLLVYEFMKNGSLESFLFPSLESSSNKKVLNWACRYSIALGTAKGIMYLHEECRDCILHCDVKPENILLDEKHNARISDFGFSRLLNLNDQRHRSLIMVRGTRGYIAPEWMSNLPIISKADVYSYGMVLLEIVCGKRNFEVSPETNNKKFSLWAYEEFDKGNVVAVVDKRLMQHDVDVAQAMRAIQVSFWCIQEQPSLRPTMGKVVQMLEGIVDIHKSPPPLSMVEGQSPQTLVATSISYSSEMALISSLNLES